jgi:hypothetical protein
VIIFVLNKRNHKQNPLPKTNPMKNHLRFMMFSLVVISLAVLTTDCKKDEDEPVVTQVTGTASFPAGTSGDLSNAKVSLYLT